MRSKSLGILRLHIRVRRNTNQTISLYSQKMVINMLNFILHLKIQETQTVIRGLLAVM